MREDRCKICDSSSLVVFAHTARCSSCGVILYYPYPTATGQLLTNEESRSWYSKSSFNNHVNFTNMIRFAMTESDKGRKLRILDYGGAGGQFALVCKSHFPEAEVYITDISDESLLSEWRSLNIQLPFKSFQEDTTKFDFIFLNDVFEHVSDPRFVLKQLAGKLEPEGKLFIDTPKHFWIYPLARFLSKSLYAKILRGTVSTAHLQVWSKKSFDSVVQESNLKKCKYEEISEYTMPADYYLKNMGIENPAIKLAGRIFYANANWLAKNKIVCLLQRES